MNVTKLRTSVAWLRNNLHNSYALDARSLAVFRISVGLVVLIDLVFRFRYAAEFYSDSGVLPRRDVIPALSQYRWSIFFTNGTSAFVNAVFILGFLAAIAMILGWRTRVATILLWAILISVQSRNPHLSSGADTMIRVTLFWAMLLPLDTVWSVSCYLAKPQDQAAKASQPRRIATLATFGLILQLACVYLFTATMKDSPRWQEEGTALYYALGARDVTSGLGNWVFHNAPEMLLRILTYGALLLEFTVPLLLLLPLRSGWLRTIGVFLIISLHLGIALTMEVGLFPAISIASATGILPTWFWEKVAARFPHGSQALRKKLARIPELLQPLIPQREMVGSTGNLTSAVSNSAESQERHTLHFLYRPYMQRPPLGAIVSNVIAAFMIALVFVWNIQTVSAYTVPQPLRGIAISTGMYQQWSMFAPGPQMATVWYVVEGELQSGETFDVFTPIYSGDLSIKEPVVLDQSDELVIQDKYWRKYFSSIRGKDTEMQRFAGYTCRTWNAEYSGEDRLVQVTFRRAYATTLPDGKRAEPVYDQLGSWRCR